MARDADSTLKGLVLAGGKGTRLRPFTYTGAKQLVPLANKPILFYAIEELVASDVTDLGVVIGETGDQIRAALGDGSRFGARITYIEQAAPLGIAHAVQTAQPYLGDAPFVLFLGDNFVRGGIEPYVERFRAGGPDAMLLLAHVDRPQDFGVALFEHERLVRVVEKPADPPSDLAITGIYFFRQPVFDAIGRIAPSARGELEITDTVQRLIDDGRDVRADVISGRWIDTGKHDDLLAANRLMLDDLEPAVHGHVDGASTIEGAVVIEPGAEVVASTLRGPAIIGERTRVSGTTIGPYTSIDHDCVITGARIAGSVVLESTRIEHVGEPIEDSLIGRNVELLGDGSPGSYRLILGDFSRVRMP